MQITHFNTVINSKNHKRFMVFVFRRARTQIGHLRFDSKCNHFQSNADIHINIHDTTYRTSRNRRQENKK